MEPRKVVLFDLDGTLVDYHKVLKQDMLKLKSPEEPLINVNWGDRHPEHIENRKQLITSQPGWWENLPVLELGWRILEFCYEIGFEIMILTKGPTKRDNAWSEKVRWCKKNLPDKIPITITTDKSLVYGRVLVDDYPDYVTSWLERRPRGLVIMPKSDSCIGFSHPNVTIFDGSNQNEVKKKLTEAFNRKSGGMIKWKTFSEKSVSF